CRGRSLIGIMSTVQFFFSSRRRHTSWPRDWSSDVCSSDLDEVVLSFRGGQQRRVDERKNLRLYRSRARFVAPHQVQVGEEIIESEKIFLNTGGRPHIPAIPGLREVPFLTNESILELASVPQHLPVLGG